MTCGYPSDAKSRLTFVGDHDIVDPDVVTPDINAIKSTFVTTTDSHIVDFTICASVDGEVERRRVNQGNIVNRPIGDIPDSQESGTRDAALFMELVAISLNGSLASRREHLEAKHGNVSMTRILD